MRSLLSPDDWSKPCGNEFDQKTGLVFSYPRSVAGTVTLVKHRVAALNYWIERPMSIDK